MEIKWNFKEKWRGRLSGEIWMVFWVKREENVDRGEERIKCEMKNRRQLLGTSW